MVLISFKSSAKKYTSNVLQTLLIRCNLGLFHCPSDFHKFLNNIQLCMFQGESLSKYLFIHVTKDFYFEQNKYHRYLKQILTFQAAHVTLAVGFTLTFGAFFAKTWRVYKIFTASEKLKKVVRKFCFFFFALFFECHFD